MLVSLLNPKQDTIFVYSPAIHNGCCILSINPFYNRNIFLFAHNIGVLEELIDILTDLYKINFQERYHNLLRKRNHSVQQSRTERNRTSQQSCLDVTTLKTFFLILNSSPMCFQGISIQQMSLRF